MQFLIIIGFFFRVYLQCCYSSALQSVVDESKSEINDGHIYMILFFVSVFALSLTPHPVT